MAMVPLRDGKERGRVLSTAGFFYGTTLRPRPQQDCFEHIGLLAGILCW